MSMDKAFVDAVWRVFLGEIPSETEIEHVIRILGTQEEFLAWLVTRRDVLGVEPELSESLGEIANRADMMPVTRRVESGFPREFAASRRALYASIADALSADQKNLATHDAMHKALLAAAIANQAPEMPDRWFLGIKKAE